jgi:hypothetical protein
MNKDFRNIRREKVSAQNLKHHRYSQRVGAIISEIFRITGSLETIFLNTEKARVEASLHRV